MRRTTSPHRPSPRPAARVRREVALTTIAALGLAGGLAGLLTADDPAWALPFRFYANPPAESTTFLPDENGTFSQAFDGEGNPGDTVRLFTVDLGGAPEEAICTTTVLPDETWVCTVTAMPDTFGTFRAEVIAGVQLGASETREFNALNPPTLTNATGPGTAYASRFPASFAFEGTTYNDGGASTVTATVPGVDTCTVAVVAGQFTCPIDFSIAGDGTYPYTITTTTSFATSSVRSGTVLIDATGPGFTSITSPTGGQVVADLTPTIVGTGEPGGTAYPLFFPSFAPACGPTPINGAGVWSCTLAAVTPGEYTVGSYQEDAIGNTGPSPDPQVTFTVVTPPPPPPPPPAPPVTPVTDDVTPIIPTPEPSPTPDPPVEPTPSPEPTEDSTDDTDTEPIAAPVVPPEGGTVGGGGPSDPTIFGTSLRSPLDVISTPGIVLAGAISGAAAFLLFVAIPAELLHATVRENYHRLPRLRGTWRERLDRWGDAVQRRLGRTGSLIAVIALVAGLSTLVDPNAGFTASTLRLWIAIGIALFVVNVLGGLALRAAAKRWFDVEVAQRILPGAILLTAATVLLSRLFGVAPGLLFGLVLGVQLARELRRDESGRLAAFVTTVLLGIGIGAWMLYGASLALGSADPGFAELLWRETLVAITVEALSSLAIAIIPIMFLDGRSIWQWSRLAWAGLAAVIAVSFVTIIVPLPGAWAETAGPLASTVVLFVGFMVLTIVVWAVFRWLAVREERAAAAQARESAAGVAKR
ncbi:MAG: hypothetical protein LDL15_07165 [Yonghaparkia sp.]|nr:hypothetical protein [Microcella sp.]